MKQYISSRFRPSMIIFVDDVGKQICQQLQEITRFTSLDPVLCQCVALLQLQDSGDRAVLLPLGTNEATPQEEGSVEQIIERSIRDVQDHRRRLTIIDKGYAVPTPVVQIYIVGGATSPWLRSVLRIVHGRLDKMELHAPVCYLLSTYQDRMQTRARPTVSRMQEAEAFVPWNMPATQWEGRLITDFCYIYEDLLLYPAPIFVQEIESYHAAAQGLFALISTALMTEPLFEDATRLNLTRIIQRYENMGTLSVCQILFPRAHLLEYCSAMLGVTLMDQWMADIRRSLVSEAKNKELHKQAVSYMYAIEQWIAERRPRKKAWLEAGDEYLRPTLDILRQRHRPQQDGQEIDEDVVNLYNNQTRLHVRQQEAVHALFDLFDSDMINEEVARHPSKDWTRVVYTQIGKATDEFNDWYRAALSAWDTVSKRACMNVKSTIDQHWSQGSTPQAESGFELARIYVEELNDQLAKTQNRHANLRIAHRQDYEEFLREFERRSEGDWAVSEREGNIIGSDGTASQASPTMGGTHAPGTDPASDGGTLRHNPSDVNTETTKSGTTNNSDGGIVGGDQPVSPPLQARHLPEHEETIARRLEMRIKWYRDLVPPIPTLAVIATPFALAVLLAILAMFPDNLFMAVFLILLFWMLIFLVCWYKRFRRLQKVREAQRDLLIFYRRHYVYRCEVYEDQLRTRVTGRLRRQIHRMSEKLNNIYQFMDELCCQLQKRAQNVEQDLFNSPSASRNIFVANGERIQCDKNSPRDFALQLTNSRMKRPVETWHQEDRSMKEQLVALFLQHPESLLEISSEDAIEQIYNFAETVILAYFKGPLVEIKYALDKQDIWREAFDRAHTPLYRVHEGVREPRLVFVCGREEDLVPALSLLPEAYPVRIGDDHEWLLVAAFFRGAVALDTDLLFPYTDSGDDSVQSQNSSKPQEPDNVAPLSQSANSVEFSMEEDDALPRFKI